jgi:hypothetical protein
MRANVDFPTRSGPSITINFGNVRSTLWLECAFGGRRFVRRHR